MKRDPTTKNEKQSLAAKLRQPAEKFVNASNLLLPHFRFREIFLFLCKMRMSCQDLDMTYRHPKTDQNFCKDEWNEKKTFVDAVNSLKKDAVIFAIIRDPVDRFLSGYTNKCIKYCNLEKSFNHMTFLRYDLRERDRLATDLDSVLHRARVPLNQRRYIKDELFIFLKSYVFRDLFVVAGSLD
ncbi:hypothetical protein NECAME_01854 [Necator americanus]|uniref:Sulfotransferase domain-containing protein n=1 Tax=Necator americanus TaxID=51031 RepID=W2TLR8_NECAM|nr:hypothetical protein NECAME_01854 [Necator americanus]ETN83055.1 hypothetical protein NECAME_01854 [Necator americanus]